VIADIHEFNLVGGDAWSSREASHATERSARTSRCKAEEDAMNRVHHRLLSVAGACLVPVLAAAWVSGAAYPQTDFPSRRIRIVLPYPAGGIVDVVTRIVTDKLSEIWRQPIVVEAKPSAQGNLAWDEVSRAKPDGYTWTFLGAATMTNPRLFAHLRWSEKSFVPVGATVWAPTVLVVHPSTPANTVAGFVEYVRKHPGVLNWANMGIGASPQLAMASFLNATMLDVMAVPYNGAPPAILDLMANRVQFAIQPIGLVSQHIDSGALKALAVIGTTRSPLLPNVPTMSEAGYPETNVVPWYGYGAPRGTPRPVIDKISAGFNEVMQIPSVREALQKHALQPVKPMTADELAELYAADTERYAKIIREANIKIPE
jgi:tripartite-type tricarboxylate transporter receptor subunit TctC